MKKIASFIILTTISIVCFSQTINASDTVVFDMSHSTLGTNNKVSFPIRHISQDTNIVALDFSFKYNQLKLVYDTIISLQPSLISHTAYYNPIDSTVRFTSFCNNPNIEINDSISIVKIQFTILAGQLDPSDIKTVITYLNGDLCSYKITNYGTVGFNKIPYESSFNFWPNPNSGTLNIKSSNKALAVNIKNYLGQTIVGEFMLPPFSSNKLELPELSSGNYIITTNDGQTINTHKLLVK